MGNTIWITRRPTLILCRHVYPKLDKSHNATGEMRHVSAERPLFVTIDKKSLALLYWGLDSVDLPCNANFVHVCTNFGLMYKY